MSDADSGILIEAREQWRDWLGANCADTPGVWLVTWKVATGRPHVTASEDTDEALCFGWVDSRPRSVDDERRAIRVSRRAPTARWSRLNKERVARLVDEGRTTDAGLRAVRIATANGVWNALAEVESPTEPEDLAAALAANPTARANWNVFPRSTRRTILERIAAAKRPTTRADRITTTIAEAVGNRCANHWRQPNSARSPTPQP